MNRKQLGVTLILLFLMGVLLTGEKVFTSNIRRVVLTNNNIGDLNSYSDLEGMVNYRLPDSWDVEEKKYPGNYIVYDNSFVSREMGILGYVQVINSPKTIETIMQDDKDRLKTGKIEMYKTDIEKISGKDVYKVVYNEIGDKGIVYINTIYYKEISENKVLKVLFSSSEEKYKEEYKTIYKVILDSFDD